MTDSNNINKEQILKDHIQLIHRVVMHCCEPNSVADLEHFLRQAEENDWRKLVEVIRRIISGNHNRSLLHDLDEEESIIIESILNGIEDPHTLPPVPVDLNSDMAAPGIASLIHATMQGSAESQNIITNLTKQMLDNGGDVAIIAGSIRAMIEGERDLNEFTAVMSDQGQKLISGILTELTILEAN